MAGCVEVKEASSGEYHGLGYKVVMWKALVCSALEEDKKQLSFKNAAKRLHLSEKDMSTQIAQKQLT